MANTDQKIRPDLSPDMESEDHGDKLLAKYYNRATSTLTYGGYLFLCVSAASLGAAVYIQWSSRGQIALSGDPAHSDLWMLAVAHSSHILLLLTAGMGAAIGYALLRSAGTAFKEVIPQKDAALLYELLRGDKTSGLDNYVKLASLSGFVGTCFKLGITGLPLAMIGLTIFFALLGTIPGTAATGFFDLSKLTLGAFIGSFVQRARLDFNADGNDKSSGTPGNVV